MIIRALDADHDWKFGKGKQSYLYTNEAINENIQTRLLEFVNDCFFNLSAGIEWIGLMSKKGTKEQIVLSCRAVILKSFGVVRVNSVEALLIDRRSLQISYNIDTIYTLRFTQNLEVKNV